MKGTLTVLCLATITLAQTARNPLEEMTDRMATPDPLPYGPALMQQVRDNLPTMPLRLTGEIKTRQGKERKTRSLISELRFGDTPPSASFWLADAFGAPLEEFTVEWKQESPVWYQQNQPVETPEELADTGLQGSDLALEFLWWPGAEVLQIQQIRARNAYEVLLPVPESSGSVRLWVDTRALFVVEAETLDAEGNVLRRLEVDKLKKIREDLWMVQDLVVRDYQNKQTIKIRFSEVEELSR
jgi:hypothetical protein